MKLAAVNPRLDFNVDDLFNKEVTKQNKTISKFQYSFNQIKIKNNNQNLKFSRETNKQTGFPPILHHRELPDDRRNVIGDDRSFFLLTIQSK